MNNSQIIHTHKSHPIGISKSNYNESKLEQCESLASMHSPTRHNVIAFHSSVRLAENAKCVRLSARVGLKCVRAEHIRKYLQHKWQTTYISLWYYCYCVIIKSICVVCLDCYWNVDRQWNYADFRYYIHRKVLTEMSGRSSIKNPNQPRDKCIVNMHTHRDHTSVTLDFLLWNNIAHVSLP